MEALGFIEMPNLSDAFEALDMMLKAADIEFMSWEKKFGGRLVTIIIRGGIADVTEAVDAAKSSAKGRIAASAVIGNPHTETMKMVMRSAEKYSVNENERGNENGT